VQAGKGRSAQAEKRKEMQCNSQLIPTTTKLIDRSLLLILACVILLFLCCNFGRLSYDMQEHEVAHWIDSSSFYTLMSCTTT
jgi:hypothetical protein